MFGLARQTEGCQPTRYAPRRSGAGISPPLYFDYSWYFFDNLIVNKRQKALFLPLITPKLAHYFVVCDVVHERPQMSFKVLIKTCEGYKSATVIVDNVTHKCVPIV